MKKHLTRDEEFQIMKLVLDKFLWLGVGIMAYGFWVLIQATQSIWYGLSILLGGAVMLVLFMLLLVKEFKYVQ